MKHNINEKKLADAQFFVEYLYCATMPLNCIESVKLTECSSWVLSIDEIFESYCIVLKSHFAFFQVCIRNWESS